MTDKKAELAFIKYLKDNDIPNPLPASLGGLTTFSISRIMNPSPHIRDYVELGKDLKSTELPMTTVRAIRLARRKHIAKALAKTFAATASGGVVTYLTDQLMDKL